MLLENNNLIIVDIGASGGIHPRWKNLALHFIGILFEPDSREYSTLKENSESNLIVLNSALSDSRKEVEFNLCKKQTVSSVYKPNFNFLDKFTNSERFKVEKNIKLNADTLGNQLKINNINEVDFIKIDTQGYGLPILRGYANNFDSVIGLEIEVEFEPMYEGQPLFSDVDKGGVYYFDSYGIEPPKEVKILMNRLTKQGKSHNSGMRKYSNNTRHQYKNSECGVYSINFIVKLLEGKSFKEITDNIIKDDDIFHNFPDHESLDNVINNVFLNYYKNWNCDYIIDRGPWGTPTNLMLLKKIIIPVL